ncbi:MAG: hypothetical protein H7Z15_01825 [Rhizobacter sp.]|nr:hypothetical protein [Rhizobacter sp.]
MAATVQSILGHLDVVARERAARAVSSSLSAKVRAIKGFQQKRFSHTYADLLATARYAGAARFFLEELYGPGDFSQRDTEFARVVPALVRLFPRDVVETVDTLAQLHALSEQLDSAMAHELSQDEVDAGAYIAAWQATGQASQRELQIALTLSVGQSLDDLTRKPLLRHTLRMMRGPARAAGLSALQQFLESGFDTFLAMRGAKEFLSTVSAREHLLAASLFDKSVATDSRARDRALGQLP